MDVKEEGNQAQECDNKRSFKFSNDLSLEEIRTIQADFCKQRDWDQFHSPRNLLLAMVGEVGELAELFQWKGEVKEGLPEWSDKEKTNLEHELSDVLIYLVRLADKCNIDLPVAVLEKIELNKKKYPADIVRGQSKKYTEYEINGEPEAKKSKDS